MQLGPRTVWIGGPPKLPPNYTAPEPVADDVPQKPKRYKDSNVGKIRTFVAQHPGCLVSEIAAVVTMKTSTAKYMLRLEARGILRSEGERMNKRWWIK